MSIIKEFKEFAMRGNVVDLAVGVVIGAAFGKIVTSLVTDVIMPLIGVLTGGLNFTDYKVILRPGVLASEGIATPALTLNYGTFLQVVIDFLIVAFCIFMVIKAMNKVKKKEEKPAEKGPTQENFGLRLEIFSKNNSHVSSLPFLSHGITLSLSEEKLFQDFLSLFREYNAHTNLSAIRDEEGIIVKHFIDSLAVLRAVHLEGRVLDIGSGGGFPGIPLKIIQPMLRMTLLDSVGKKVKAMNHFVQKLELRDIVAIQERAEILAKNPDYAGKYDFVVSRATAYMSDILHWSAPFLKRNGKIILYKIYSEEEHRDGEKIARKLGLMLEKMHQYELAGQTRCLYVFQKNKKPTW